MISFFEFIAEHYGAMLGTLAAFVIFFERLANVTPTDADNKVVRAMQRIFTVLGIKISDIEK